MSFGLSRNDSRSEMIGADAVVAFFDAKTGRGHAVDYYLQSAQQCVGGTGSQSFEGACPDVKLSSTGSDSITLLHAAVVNGYTMVTFKRPQVAGMKSGSNNKDVHFKITEFIFIQLTINWISMCIRTDLKR